MSLLATHRSGTISLKERRDEKASLEGTLIDAIDAVDWFLSTHEGNITVESVMNFMEDDDVFCDIPCGVSIAAKDLIERRLTDYLRQRARVEAYRKNYRDDLGGLLEEVFKTPTPHPGKKPLTAIWEPDCVTVVLPNRIYNHLNGESRNSHRSVGWALTDKALNVARRNTKSELAATHIHEKRHQRNRHLMPEIVTYLDQAQNEILAYMEEDYGERQTLEALTEPHDIYDYYDDLKKTAKDATEKQLVQRKWRVHCRRVAKGIQMASHVGKSRMDELSIKPLAQWRKLLNIPPTDDFFFPNGEGQLPTARRIADIFRKDKNRDLISKAGLGDPGEIEKLLPENSEWRYLQAESGIVSFTCIDGPATGTEFILIPSISAIHQAKD